MHVRISLLLLLLASLTVSASAETVIYFTGNTYGEHSPCPS